MEEVGKRVAQEGDIVRLIFRKKFTPVLGQENQRTVLSQLDDNFIQQSQRVIKRGSRLGLCIGPVQVFDFVEFAAEIHFLQQNLHHAKFAETRLEQIEADEDQDGNPQPGPLRGQINQQAADNNEPTCNAADCRFNISLSFHG